MESRKWLFITVLPLLVIPGCVDDDLPDPTREGLNTLGMRIDGALWEPKDSNSLFGPSASNPLASYDDGFLVIRAFRSSSILFLYASGIDTEGDYTFSFHEDRLLNPTCADSTRFEQEEVCLTAHQLFPDATNSLKITRLDTIERIIAGRFELELQNRMREVITLSDGRFDMTY